MPDKSRKLSRVLDFFRTFRLARPIQCAESLPCWPRCDSRIAADFGPGLVGAPINNSRRVFLFLQGPISPFFQRLAAALLELGHEVRRVNLCFGDRLLWRKLPSVNYTGTAADWPEYIGAYMAREGITDLVLLGDRRPLHIQAADLARASGIRVFACELGYLRPDWITLERNGMSSYSHFPTDPTTIRKISECVPPPDMTARYQSNFFKLAAWDVTYNLANVFLWPCHPHYRWHAIYHPLAEYAGWVWRLLRRPYLKWDARTKFDRLLADKGKYYVFPLQLETDYQIRAHSPYARQKDPIRTILASFAKFAAADTSLLIKVHPLDNGLFNWRRRIARWARERDVENRVVVVDGGDLTEMLAHSTAVVTINSTVGTAALALGKPLLALGSAVYVMDGLTHKGTLDDFWTGAEPPDRELYGSFVRALAATVQIKGGFYSEPGIAAAVSEAAKRLDQLTVNEPLAFVDPPPRLARIA